jgi:V/A-type H+-transporting ATPase subunit I
VFWGALFGSWFGDAIPLVAREFFGKEIGTVALWFDPLTDPITLLLFSFCIGIVHLFLGLGAFGYMKWKAGDKVGAICDTIPVMMTVAGAAPLAAGVLVSVPVAITGVAKYVAIVGVVLVILTTARSGNILLRLGGGLYGLYNMASGYLSDILSVSMGIPSPERIPQHSIYFVGRFHIPDIII